MGTTFYFNLEPPSSLELLLLHIERSQDLFGDASWMPPWRGVPGMPHQGETQRKTQGLLDGRGLMAGLGTPWVQERRAGGGHRARVMPLRLDSEWSGARWINGLYGPFCLIPAPFGSLLHFFRGLMSSRPPSSRSRCYQDRADRDTIQHLCFLQKIFGINQ